MIYLSICIPTYERLEILENTICSIYADTAGVDLAEFEVVISDNTPKGTAESVVKRYDYSNLVYHHTNCEGFLNSFYAMEYGNGLYLKLHNNQVMLKTGVLKEMIAQVKRNKDQHIQVVYTNGSLLNFDVTEHYGFDEFMNDLSYFCSWSAGFGMWREDYHRVKDGLNINKFFPQTSLLLTCDNNKRFAIDDRDMFEFQPVPQKGGYNSFEVFGIDLVSMLEEANVNGAISYATFAKVKKGILLDYLAECYLKTCVLRLDNYDTSDIKKHILSKYSYSSYLCMLFSAFFVQPFKLVYKKTVMSLHRFRKQ